MLQRLSTKLRSLSIPPNQCRRLLHFSAPQPNATSRAAAVTRFNLDLSLYASSSPPRSVSLMSCQASSSSSLSAVSLIQRRYYSPKDKLRRTPTTPITSKLKKTKMKSYSSYKSRFKTLNDGTIRRWREGKRHNAHLKSKKSKRRLRRPALVHAAYAKVMKKLNFCG